MTCYHCGRKVFPGAVWCYRCANALQKTKEGRRLYRLVTGVGIPLDQRHDARRKAGKVLRKQGRTG